MRLKQQIRKPRLAEIVADGLRERILSDELPEGGVLPRAERLVEEFRVGLPSIREALRILETEGLLTIRRGSAGGARVHKPQSAKAAYMLGLVLQAREVSLSDVSCAIAQLEPICAACCAARPDRDTTVMLRLDAVIKAARKTSETYTYLRLVRQFHIELVAGCGNETISLAVGALESLWETHVDAFARQSPRSASFADGDFRAASATEHERLFHLIGEGNATGAEIAAREHLRGTVHRHESIGRQHLPGVVTASILAGL